jgi:hypothetical protein
LKVQIVVRSGIWLLARKPTKRWKLKRSSSWNSICSSLKLNSCWINSTRTISSVGNGGRPPRSRLGRGAARSTSAARAAKSTCCSITCSASPSWFSLASRSWSANRLVLIMKIYVKFEAPTSLPDSRRFFEVPAKGGVLGKKLEVISRDDGSTPGDAVRVADELVTREGVNI